jgi:hypothetical protein
MKPALTTALLSLALTGPLAAESPEAPVQETAQPTAARTVDFATLVPDDTIAVVRADSIATLTKTVRRLVGAVDPTLMPLFDPRELLTTVAPVEGDLDLVDRSRPVGIAFSIDRRTLEPTPTWIVPVLDAKDYVASLPAESAVARQGYKTPVVHGDWVAISRVTGYAPSSTPNVLAVAMPDAAVSARVDLQAVVAAYGPMLRMLLDHGVAAASGDAPAGAVVAGGMMDGLQQALATAELLELTVDAHSTELAVEFTFTAAEGSPLAPPETGRSKHLGPLAGRVTGSSTFSFLAGADLGAMTTAMMPFMDTFTAGLGDQMPPQFAAELERSKAQMAELAPLLGEGMACNVDVVGTDVRVDCWLRPDDPAMVLERYAAMIAETPTAGTEVQGPEAVTIGERKLLRFRTRVDPKTLSAMSAGMDPDTLAAAGAWTTIHLAATDGWFFSCVGGDEEWIASRLETAAPRPNGGASELADAVRDATGPAFVFQVDLARALGESLGLTLPADVSSVPVTLHAYAQGRAWRAGLGMDVARYAGFAARMTELAGE